MNSVLLVLATVVLTYLFFTSDRQRPGGPLVGNVGDQPIPKRFLLNLPLEEPSVQPEAVYLNHPGVWVVLYAAGQCPFRGELANLEHGPDRLRLALARVRGNAERLVDGGYLHVELGAAV